MNKFGLTGEQEREFSTIKEIVKLMSNGHASHMIENSLLRIGLLYFVQDVQVAQDLHKLGLSFVNSQDLRKILSPMRNICARLYFFLQCARPPHHLCTQHHHSAGHKIFYFLIQIDRLNYLQQGEKSQIRCDFLWLLRIYLKW